MLTCVSCRTPGVIQSNAPAEVARLNADFKLIVREGEAPLVIESDDEEAARFAIYPRGRSPQYLILVHPEKVSGNIMVNVGGDEEVIESAPEYNTYVDRLLAAHRLLLKGKFEEAKGVVDRLDNEYLITHGTLMLRASLHAAAGDGAKAIENLQMARLPFDPQSGGPPQ